MKNMDFIVSEGTRRLVLCRDTMYVVEAASQEVGLKRQAQAPPRYSLVMPTKSVQCTEAATAESFLPLYLEPLVF